MIISLALRTGAIVGVVYYTKRLGVWGDAEETAALYEDIKAAAKPQMQRLERSLPFDVPALPQTGEIRFLAKYYYNQGIKSTFHFIEMIPCYAGQLVKKASDTFKEFSTPPPPAESTKK